MSPSTPARTLMLALLLGTACRQPAPLADEQEDALSSLRAADSALQAAISARDLDATTTLAADEAS